MYTYVTRYRDISERMLAKKKLHTIQKRKLPAKPTMTLSQSAPNRQASEETQPIGIGGLIREQMLKETQAWNGGVARVGGPCWCGGSDGGDTWLCWKVANGRELWHKGIVCSVKLNLELDFVSPKSDFKWKVYMPSFLILLLGSKRNLTLRNHEQDLEFLRSESLRP